MQTYATKRKSAEPAPGDKAAESISKSEMLRMSGAGAPQPMSPALREKFEPGFGADFSNIRISRGHIPEEMGVQAVAKGTDILIDSRAGMDVLGHELAHVVQQAQGQVQGGFPVVHDAALEHQADVMGARVASGMSAMEGGMSGFGGGEMMSIAPMSGAEAPAQCKSREEKKKDKIQVSEPTYVPLGKDYQNEGLDASALKYAKMGQGSTQDVALSQMLDTMKDASYMQKIADYNGGTTEGVASRMGEVIGARSAQAVASRDTHNSESRDSHMYRGSELDHQNLGKFVRGQLGSNPDRVIQGALGGTLSRREVDGKAITELDSSTIAQTMQDASQTLTGSAPIMALSDSFLANMSGGPDSREELQKKMTNQLFLRGYNPAIIEGIGKVNGEDKKKLMAFSTQMQLQAANGRYQNILAGRPAVPKKSGWRKADVSDAAYSQAPQQMAGSQRNAMNKLKKLGFY